MAMFIVRLYVANSFPSPCRENGFYKTVQLQAIPDSQSSVEFSAGMVPGRIHSILWDIDFERVNLFIESIKYTKRELADALIPKGWLKCSQSNPPGSRMLSEDQNEIGQAIISWISQMTFSDVLDPVLRIVFIQTKRIIVARIVPEGEKESNHHNIDLSLLGRDEVLSVVSRLIEEKETCTTDVLIGTEKIKCRLKWTICPYKDAF
jgi:hypothetical protein